MLATLLGNTNLEVPGRISGRSKDHTERWIICRLLATLADKGRLGFPLSLTHLEKPDFTLAVPGRTIGVEATEAISEDFARCAALAERENPNAVIDMSKFRWGDPPKSLAALREILNASRFDGDGWSGESAELEWARYIASIVVSKTSKLGCGHRPHPAYWLAIYDNLPLPNVHLAQCYRAAATTDPYWWRVRGAVHRTRAGHAEITHHNVQFHNLRDLW